MKRNVKSIRLKGMLPMLSIGILFILCSLSFPVDSPKEYAPNEILVKFKNSQEDNSLETLRNSINAIKVKKFAINDVYQLRLPAGTSVESAVIQAYSDPNVIYAEPNFVLDINTTPNDTRFDQLYGLHNTGQTGGTADADIDAPEAWSQITDVPDNIVIAVIDTGVDYNHQDLADNMWVNSDEIPDNGIDDDSNGYIDDYRGWDFSNNDNNPMDGHSHGTHCAGTIAAVGNNSLGVVGVCWKAKIMPVKFLSDSGSGYTSDAIESIQYAVDNGAKVLSNSWGGGGYSQALSDAIQESSDAGCIFVAAAGNSATNNDSIPHYPSSYNVSNVIAVAATDNNDNLAYFSCYGLNSVDIAAPGVGILSTVPGNGYSSYSGTSMATPHISGMCALIWASSPDLTNIQLKARLFSTVDAKPSLAGKTVTGGRANLYRAITSEEDSTPPAAITNLLISGDPTYKSVTMTATATGDDNLTGTASSYDLRYSTSPIDENNFLSATTATGLASPKASGSTETFNVVSLQDDTAYYFAVKVIDNWGNTSEISNVVSAKTLKASIIYQDKVESGTNGWTIAGTDGAGGASLWHRANHRFVSSDTAWYYGKEPDRTYDTGNRNYGSITSPAIDLKDATEADLAFNYWRLVESYGSDYDVFKIEFSDDDGTTWETLKTISSTTASQKQWVSSGNLTIPTGSSLCKIRFSFDSIDNISNSYEGIYIDDIEIVGIIPSDNIAPNAITTLTVSQTGVNHITLSWTSTGDDENTGTASTYDLRYSETAITEENWGSATEAVGEPKPMVAGSEQTYTITGLTSGTKYYFAIKAFDNGSNSSGISNCVNTTLLSPPVAEVAPESMPVVILTPDASTTKTLEISNSGGSDLNFSVTDAKVNNLLIPELIAEQTPDEEYEELVSSANAEYEAGELLIKIRPGTSLTSLSNCINVEATTLKTFAPLDIQLIKINSDKSLKTVLDQYSALEDVVYVEYNYKANALLTPDDAKFSQLYGLHNTAQTGGTADADIDAPEAWDYFTGSEEMVVAVIDTGVDYNHTDLANNMWKNTGEIPENGIDDDSNGFVDDVYGYDFYNSDGDPYDDHSHGTHCSGTIGGEGNNGTGVVGVNWKVKIMALKFLSASGSGSYANAIASILYATSMGAKISSNSWGGSGYSLALKEAVEYANSQGCLFIAAAGNSAANSDTNPLYPAAYSCQNIISVAATDHSDNRAWFSNYGANSVDLGAPGVSILSTLPNNTYGKYSGTSMAAPHVSGACALVWGQTPGLTHAQVKEKILSAVDPIPALSGNTVTGGRLNVSKAIVTEDDSIAPAAIDDILATNKTFKSVTLTWTATGDDNNTGTATLYDLRYSTSAITADNFANATKVANEPSPASAGTKETVSVSGLDYDTTYYFALKVKDNVSNISNLSNVVSSTTKIPTIVFQDNMDSGTSLWNAQDPWEQTTKEYKSSLMSWTDSANSQYENNKDVSLTSAPIDLSLIKEASLVFEHKYSFESNYDYGYIEISTDNGTSWTQLSSYTGAQSNWKKQSIDLADYSGSQVKVRFRLVTDYSIVEDGWYIDNVLVYGSTQESGWLTLSPQSGTIKTGENKTITFTYDASKTDLGSHSTNINISTNDPDKAIIVVPAYLIVEPTPAIAPPAIDVTSINNGQLLKDNQITVSGTIDYDYSVVTVNGVSAQVTNNTYSATITLSEGSNTISVVAVNNAGTTTDSLTVTLDTVDPSIAISSPSNGTKTTSSSVSVSGTSTDNTAIASVTINSKQASLNGNSFSANDVSLDEGTNTIIAQSVDSAGNIKTTSITVIKDTTAPSININYPQNNSYVNVSTITVTGTASDANTISSVTVNGLNASIESNSFSASGIALSEGTNTITISAIDELNNRNNSSVTVVLDTIAPSISISSPTAGTVTKNSKINISGSVNESCQSVLVNGRSATISGKNFTLSNLVLSAGTNTIIALAKDMASNTNSISLGVIYEVPAAGIKITPSTISEVTLSAGDSTSQSFTIESTGGSDLDFTISLTNTSSNLFSTSLAQSSENSLMTAPEMTAEEITPDTPEDYRDIKVHPSRLLVKFKNEISSLAIDNLNALVGAETLAIYQEIGVHKLEISSEIDLREALYMYKNNDQVEYAEPDYIVETCKVSNDPSLSQLWGLHNYGQTGGSDDADIDAPEAWNVTTGSSSVIIAVIDTGVDYTHQDIAANMWKNTDEIPGNGIDDDGNGYIDDYYGYDFCNDDGDPYDDHSHGTHCSGTIAGVGNNGVGVVGVNWTARIMAVKFLSSYGSGSISDAVSGTIYAVNNGARILSNSWGGGGYSQALKDAIDYADNNNVIFVAAAGNEGSNNDQIPAYPATYDCSNIISVAAIDHSDNLAYFSCYGAETVDIGAPGVSIYSTTPGNNYASYSGTSMATPHVAGVAGLLLAKKSTLTNAQVKAFLLGGAVSTSALNGKCVSGGRLNAYNALEIEDDNVAPAAISDLKIAGITYQSVTLNWTATGDDGASGQASSYDIRYSTSEITTSTFSSATKVSNTPTPEYSGIKETLTVSGLSDATKYYFAIKASDNAANSSALSNVVNVTTTQGVALFSDNFESGTNGWITSGTNGVGGATLWHLSNHKYSSSNTAWYYGIESQWNYNSGGLNYGTLMSPEIDLSNVEAATLGFDFWREVESYPGNYDVAYVDIYCEGNYETVWYKSSGDVSGKEWKYSGPIDLSHYSGKSIRIAFKFTSVDGVANYYEGWYIDDVQLYGSNATEDWISFSPNLDSLAPGENTEVTLYYNGDVSPGEYTGSLHVNSNDPANSSTVMELNLTVSALPSLRWYLPEGCTDGFDQYVLVMNPNSTMASVKVTFMRSNGSTVEEYISVGPFSRYTIYANDIVPFESFSTMVESLNNVAVIAERAMYWNSGDITWAGGHCSPGITELNNRWYFAEGCTDGFDEFILLQNPNSTGTNVTATFVKPDGSTVVENVYIGPTSRYTIHVNTIVPNESVSTIITSDLNIAAERAMYWDNGGYRWIGGHIALGVREPSTQWYMAEGCTNGFDEWVLLMNPNSQTANVAVTFMKSDGTTVNKFLTMGGTTRYSIDVNSVVPNESLSTLVSSDIPIVAERAMYWDVSGVKWMGGHVSPAATAGGLRWNLAEGYTGSTFDEWILVMNPNSSTARIKVTFMTPDGHTIVDYITIPPTSRYTIHADEYVSNNSISTTVDSINGVTVIVERAMYWDSTSTNNLNFKMAGGHASLGVE